MPALRVYELAKEMDMNSKALLDTMIEMGLPMKNHMSTIPSNEVNRIRAMVMKHLGHPDAEPVPRPPEKKEAPPLAGLRRTPAQRAQAMEQAQSSGRGGAQAGARPGSASAGYAGQGRYAQGAQSDTGQLRPGQTRPGGTGGSGPAAAGQSRPGQARPGQSQPGQARPGQGPGQYQQPGQARPGQGLGQGGAVQTRAGYAGQGAGAQSLGSQDQRRRYDGARGDAGAQAQRPQGAGAQSRPAGRPQGAAGAGNERAQSGYGVQVTDRGFRSGLGPDAGQPPRRAQDAPQPRGPREGAQSPRDGARAVGARDVAQGIATQDAAREARETTPRRQPGDSISPEEARALALARQRRLEKEAAEAAAAAEEARARAAEQSRARAQAAQAAQDAQAAQTAQARSQAQTPETDQAPPRRRQPGESIRPEEARAQARARRQPGDSISPDEARAQARALRKQDEDAVETQPEQGAVVTEATSADQRAIAGSVDIAGATGEESARQGESAAGEIGAAAATSETVTAGEVSGAGAKGLAQAKSADTTAAGKVAPQRQAQPRGQSTQGARGTQGTQSAQAEQNARNAGRPGTTGQGFGQSRTQSFADRFAKAPGQAQTKAPKPKRAPAPADSRTRGFNKGPKAPVIGRDTADQLSHLGSAGEEDSRFLNKVENAVGEKAYDRGGITRTPSRKQNRYEESRPTASRSRARSGKDRGRQVRQEPAPVVIKTITIDGPTTVMDFARLLGKKTSDIIKRLISYGIMANVNYELDLDTLTLLGQDFGTQVEARVTREDRLVATDGPDNPLNLIERPPVVTIMGHVDHGKTSLLDAIRKANVTASEAGGITQHIGAYQAEINNRMITFLDTPGHEAFTAMRARGAQCTDIAILVVAADDGVMPQTVEAINHAKAANVPIIVAINKIDLESANPERVKQELTEYGLLAEEWGGETIFAEVSAKTKQGIDSLLEMILLVADVGDLKANPNRKAKGVVIEAKLDRGRGPVATVLVQNGTLLNGDFLIVGSVQGRIRLMNDDKGKPIKQAGPSTPVEVVGLSDVPMAGDVFQVVEDERLAKQIADERTALRREEFINSRTRVSLDDLFARIQTGEVKDLNIIIKADVQGSIEALKTSLEKLSNNEVRVQTIHQGVGGITEADVDFAIASNAIILGFNVRPDANAKKVAETNQVDIRLYRVIYNAIEDVKSALSGLLTPEIRENVIGRAEVRQVIRVPRVGVIAGCYILDGKITRGCQLRVIRDNIVIHEGSIGSLRRFKDDVREVATGFECGIGIDRFQDFRDGDNIEGFVLEEIKRELA